MPCCTLPSSLSFMPLGTSELTLHAPQEFFFISFRGERRRGSCNIGRVQAMKTREPCRRQLKWLGKKKKKNSMHEGGGVGGGSALDATGKVWSIPKEHLYFETQEVTVVWEGRGGSRSAKTCVFYMYELWTWRNINVESTTRQGRKTGKV